MAFYSYLSTKIIIAFITKSYQDLFGVRSYINALFFIYWIHIISSVGTSPYLCLCGEVADSFKGITL